MTLCSIDFGPKKLLEAAGRALAEGRESRSARGVQMGVGPPPRPAEMQLPVECGPEREPLREPPGHGRVGRFALGRLRLGVGVGRPGLVALPHGGLVELGVGVRQGSAVAAGAAHGEGRTGSPAEHLAWQGVQSTRQARLRARCVRVRDHVGEPGVVGGVWPGQRRL